MSDDEFSLSVETARQLSDAELRERFEVAALDLIGSFGQRELPAGFPRYPGLLTRHEIFAALAEFGYWFDPPPQS